MSCPFGKFEFIVEFLHDNGEYGKTFIGADSLEEAIQYANNKYPYVLKVYKSK